METKKLLINKHKVPLIHFGLRLPESIGREIQRIASDQGKSYNLFLADMIVEALTVFKAKKS